MCKKMMLFIFSLLFSVVSVSSYAQKEDYIYYEDGNKNVIDVLYGKSVVSEDFLTNYYFKNARENADGMKSKENIGRYTISVDKKTGSSNKNLYKWSIELNKTETTTENQKNIVNTPNPYIFITISNSKFYTKGTSVKIVYISGLKTKHGDYLFESFTFDTDINKPISVNLMDDLLVKIKKNN